MKGFTGMAIDYNLLCDKCGVTIDGSSVSAAHVRMIAKAQGLYQRVKGKELCRRCIPLLTEPKTERDDGKRRMKGT